MSRKNFIIIEGEGDPCPRCGHYSQIREHRAIRSKELSQSFYYKRWFMCIQPQCQTNMFAPERYKVFKKI